MFNKKRLFIFGAFLIALFFMTMYAGSPDQNETIATRTVKFIDGYNNSEINSQKIEVGKEANVPGEPKHENLVFIGWYDGETKVSQFNNIIKDLTLIAKYADDANNNGIADASDTYYNVTFYDPVGNDDIRIVRVLSGMNATAPTVPSYTGRTFTGWSRSFNNITANITVNANYRTTTELTNPVVAITTYEVKFINGMTGDLIGTSVVEAGLTASSPAVPKYPKKVFAYWEGSYSNVRNNVTVTAIFKDDINENGKADDEDLHYGINFVVDGKGTLKGNTEFKDLLVYLVFYDNLTVPTVEAEEGYTFMGWEPLLPKSGSKITGNETFTAVFKDITAPAKPLVEKNGYVSGTWTNDDVKLKAYGSEETGKKIKYQFRYNKEDRWQDYDSVWFNTNYNVSVTFRAVDEAGNISDLSETIHILIDKDKPAVEIQNVNNYNPKSFDVFATDALSGLKRMDYSLWTDKNTTQLGVWGEWITGEAKEFTKTNITKYKKDGVSKLFSELPDGDYTLRATAGDKAGNSKNAVSINFIVDNTNPTIKVNLNRKSYLSNGGYTNALSKPEVEAKDENLDGFGIFDASGKRVAGPTGENVKERRAEIGWLKEGTYTIVAVDKAGNKSAAFTVTIDKTSPIAKITSPDVDGNLFGKNILITGEVENTETNIKSHWFEITNPDGTLSYASNMSTDKLSYSFSLDTSKGSGSYKIRYVATDKAGNRSDDPSYKNSVIRLLNIDVTNPETTLEVSKIEDGKFTVSGKATDNTRLNRVYVQLVNRTTNERCGGTTINLLSPDQKEANWSVDYDIRTLTVTGGTKSCSKEGYFAAHVSVVDQFGNSGSTGWTENFLIDITKPVINAYLDTANTIKVTNGQNINHNGYLNINIVDANIDKFYINDVEYTQYLGASWFNIAWAIKTDGVYTLKAVDKVGNESTLKFTYDTVSPVLTLKGSNTLEFYRGETYKETFSNLESTDSSDTIFVSKITFKAEGTSSYEEVNKVDTSKTGVYYVYYQSKDLAGNLSNEVSRGILVKSFSFTATVVSRNLEYIEPILPSTSYSKQGGGFQLFSATLDKELNLNNLSLYYAYGDSSSSLTSKTNTKALKSSLNDGVAGPVSTKVSSLYKNGIMPAGITVNHQENALLSNHRDFANLLLALPEGESIYVRTVLVYTLFGYSYEAPIGNFVKYTKNAAGKIAMEKF